MGHNGQSRNAHRHRGGEREQRDDQAIYSGGLVGTLSDAGGGSIELTNATQTSVKIDSSGITISAPTGKVQITAAAEVDVNAPTVNISAAMSIFSGIVQCQVLQATTVVATTYTPGAGNVW